MRSHSYAGHQQQQRQQQQQHNHFPHHSSHQSNPKRPGLRRHKSHDHKDFGKGSNDNTNNNNNNCSFRKSATTPERKHKKKPKPQELDVSLLTTTGEGRNEAEKQVIRVSQEVLFSRRMQYLDPPSEGSWSVHERILWKGEKERLDFIEQQMKAHFDFKPLQVNDETRWKPKIMKNSADQGNDPSNDDTNAEKLRMGIAILNKLSWTNLEKLTVQFLEALGVSSSKEETEIMCEKLLRESMTMVLEKAMLEPHFAELYAGFSSKLSEAHTGFRNVLLALCQETFDRIHTEEEEKEKDAEGDGKKIELMKKKAIGLMRFIGELYKSKLLKGRIMVSCLQLLLTPDDEEKLECYTQLMTTIGARLHLTIAKQVGTSPDAKAAMEELQQLWRKTYSMAGRPCPRKLALKGFKGPVAPSNRIKFLLQDLIDLKENDWISQLRHRQEKAKTIQEIHKEVAREEEEAARRNNSHPARVTRSQSFNTTTSRSNLVTRSNSFNSGGNQARAVAPTRPDTRPSGRGRGRGRGQPARRTKSECLTGIQTGMRRSLQGPPSPVRFSGLPSSPNEGQAPGLNRQPSESLIDFKIVEYEEPSECGEKMKTLLKEFFIVGDYNDALLTLEELVGMGDEGDGARGTAVVEAGVLLVMEMKQEHVTSFRSLIAKCLEVDQISRQSLARGLRDPIEFLRDIEIDAPRAGDYLAEIVSGWMRIDDDDDDDPLSLASLLLMHPSLPTKAADFAIDVLARRDGNATESEVGVVRALLAKRGDEENRSAAEIGELIEKRRSQIDAKKVK